MANNTSLKIDRKIQNLMNSINSSLEFEYERLGQTIGHKEVPMRDISIEQMNFRNVQNYEKLLKTRSKQSGKKVTLDDISTLDLAYMLIDSNPDKVTSLRVNGYLKGNGNVTICEPGVFKEIRNTIREWVNYIVFEYPFMNESMNETFTYFKSILKPLNSGKKFAMVDGYTTAATIIVEKQKNPLDDVRINNNLVNCWDTPIISCDVINMKNLKEMREGLPRAMRIIEILGYQALKNNHSWSRKAYMEFTRHYCRLIYSMLTYYNKINQLNLNEFNLMTLTGQINNLFLGDVTPHKFYYEVNTSLYPQYNKMNEAVIYGKTLFDVKTNKDILHSISSLAEKRNCTNATIKRIIAKAEEKTTAFSAMTLAAYQAINTRDRGCERITVVKRAEKDENQIENLRQFREKIESFDGSEEGLTSLLTEFDVFYNSYFNNFKKYLKKEVKVGLDDVTEYVTCCTDDEMQDILISAIRSLKDSGNRKLVAWLHRTIADVVAEMM